MSLNSNQSTSREKSNREGVSYRWLFVILGFFVLWVGTNFVFSQSDKEKKPWNPNDSSMSSSADKAARSSTLKKGTKSVSAVPEELKREREIRADALNAPAPTQSTSSVSETATTSAPVTAPAEAAAEEKNYYLPDYEPLPSKKLSLDESIQKSLEQNLDIKIKSTDRSIADDQKRQALGQFNPTLKFDGNYEEIDRSQNTQDFVSTGGDEGALRLNRQPRLFQEKNYRTKLSLEGELPTGTKYELFTKMDVLSNTLTKTSPSALYDHEYQSFTGFSLTQPLLKGFGTDVGMTQIRVARKNQQISQQEFRSQMLETVATTLQTYYDVIYLAQDFRLKQEEVKLARRLTEEKRRLFERVIVCPRDINRGETALAQTIEEVTQSQNKLLEKQTQLFALMANVDPSAPLFLIEPTSMMPDQAPILDAPTLVREAMVNRPEYIVAKYKVEREGIKLVYAENQIWPQLDLKTTMGNNGLDMGFSRSYQNAFRGQTAQWSAGVLFSVPIGNDKAIGEKNEAIHNKEVALLTLQQIENNTSLGVQQFVGMVKSNIKRYDAMTLFRRNAERALDEEEIRLEKGLSTDIDLLKFRRDVTDAKTREYAARADVNKTLVRLYQLTGTLLARQNITVSE